MICRSFVCEGIRYQLEEQRCGKANCSRCPHGPYWRAYWWDGKRQLSKYVGKKLPPGVEPGQTQLRRLPSPPELSKRDARRLLGLIPEETFLMGQRKWQALRKEAMRKGDVGRDMLLLLDKAWAAVWEDLG